VEGMVANNKNLEEEQIQDNLELVRANVKKCT
jgi:hypothetical protein